MYNGKLFYSNSLETINYRFNGIYVCRDENYLEHKIQHQPHYYQKSCIKNNNNNNNLFWRFAVETVTVLWKICVAQAVENTLVINGLFIIWKIIIAKR